MDRQFFYDLRVLAQTHLSTAHLKQHAKIAQEIVNSANVPVVGTGSWSSMKKQDTVIFKNNTVTGQKYWISGLTDSQWATIVVKEEETDIIVLVQINQGTIELVPTVGMEATMTGHITFKNCPAVKLMPRNDPRMVTIDADADLSFITNHLGLTEALFADIDNFSGTDYSYTKKKLQLDIDAFRTLWKFEVDHLSYTNDDEFWTRRRILYAFGKKTLLLTTQFFTEITGSELYKLSNHANQRYKDALIYSTHMKNLGKCFKNLFNK